MAFSFNFGGDDIDESLDKHDDVSINGSGAATGNGDTAAAEFALVEVKQHGLNELLSTLPDQIAYSTVKITSPTGKEVLLPRRELFDVRLQLMSEDSADNDTTLADIQSSDIRTNVYEGGFKTWECSVDLSSLLLDRGPRKDIDELVRCDQIIELGAGTALPTLTLFQHCVRESISQTFTLSDYNASVLQLVTLPNILLTWAFLSPNSPLANTAEESGYLEITPELLSSFTTDLSSRSINLNFISGPWGSQLASLIPPSAPEMGTLVLAAETIYSPASTTAFVTLLIELLSRVKMAKAVVAAKRIYFGVGGSVDMMKEMCAEKGAIAYEVENSGVEGMDSGVGRALVEVQMY